MAKKLLILDAGHGGSDPGAIGHGLKEKELTVNMVNRVKACIDLHYPGIDCLLTRTGDNEVSLSARTRLANSWNGDAFLSIHNNSFSDGSANGFESFVFTTDGRDSKSFALQSALHPKLAKLWTSKGRVDRGMKKANFHVLREYRGCSVLLELGFVSNANDADLMKSESFLQAQAEAIADGVAEYFGVTKSVTKPTPVYRVVVDGKQVGAYRMPANIGGQVDEALASGAKQITIHEV